ncbi:TRAP transporter substrate-binding protein [Rhodobacteraceae bacterium RKSG542]|uniref:TRAP transporter substrate-binding protein n=1 Tax=Pseudovibrio flavus TaxID=2529854 RepID=UPI0012BCC099|nr:TRAP transporter substrate-binding protein [Pseudovibrio flavus]MTI16471.1 TRAP transporter substrate-binding protein [Pseudovibrio flavus]
MKKLLATLAATTVLSVAASGAFAAKYELRLSTVVNDPHPWTEAAFQMAKEVEEKTKGEVKITVFEGGSLGSDAAAIDQMRMGSVDFVVGGTTNAARVAPEFGVFSLSYLFENMDQFKRAMDPASPVVKQLKETISDRGMGFELLALGGGGTRTFSNNRRPINSVEDIKGLKMRVPGAKADALMWSELGALPTSMPFTEVYSAIQTGVVDSFESTISSFSSSKFYEVAKYHALTNHQIMTTHISGSSATMNRLPDEYAAIVREAANNAGKVITEAGERFDAEVLATLPSKGVTVTTVDTAPFAAKLVSLHEEIAEDAGYPEILALIRESNAK